MQNLLLIPMLFIALSLIAGGPSHVDVLRDPPKRCEVLPTEGHATSFLIDGIERFQWKFGDQYPRPFFYPFRGPSGSMLTRMGHPGAPDHDHHQSIWFAHHSVNGLDFWTNGTGTTIQQKQWYAYQDGDESGLMATALGWYDANKNEVLHQDLVAAIIPKDQDEFALEIQSTFRPAMGVESVELGTTNFGFLAIRVAKSLSAHFGDGQLTNSQGLEGENNIFAKEAQWVDYSGSVGVGQGSDRKSVQEGITCFDHPDNPQAPTPWHVRSDGWMGASYNLHKGIVITADAPLTLRYLVYSHNGLYDAEMAQSVFTSFSQSSEFQILKATKPNVRWEVVRK